MPRGAIFNFYLLPVLFFALLPPSPPPCRNKWGLSDMGRFLHFRQSCHDFAVVVVVQARKLAEKYENAFELLSFSPQRFQEVPDIINLVDSVRSTTAAAGAAAINKG